MTKDLITITLEREKAEYLAACFEDDLEWLGVTAGIDRGLCYHDFIKQVKKQRKSPEQQQSKALRFNNATQANGT